MEESYRRSHISLGSWLSTFAWLMRRILGHDSKILSPASERARSWTGLVKVICKENKEQKGKRKCHAGTPSE